MEPQKLTIKVTEARINTVSLETFYHLDDSNKAPIDYVAHFVVGEDGEYLPKDEAVKRVIVGRTLGDIKELAEMIKTSTEEAAVPNM